MHLHKIIASLNSIAISRIFVNGFLTTPITLKRRVRQDDPLSLSLLLFLLSVEPLVITEKTRKLSKEFEWQRNTKSLLVATQMTQH